MDRLSTLLDDIILKLSKNEGDTSKNYIHLWKAKNILDNKNSKGIKNIKRHLFMDFRMIRDNQVDDADLSEKMDEAYTLAAALSEGRAPE
ncbi:hypothetical protein [Aestuariispira ectoiniformans]|uniref:hypothetical protein n=1 Tax=Aestuariispira ectoiniformans TaxID=2775080 RepID=UPI00223B9775|nr:hypothetical protein [Aestuariispira ectoiniformans]